MQPIPINPMSLPSLPIRFGMMYPDVTVCVAPSQTNTSPATS